jgi:hypothetical protein
MWRVDGNVEGGWQCGNKDDGGGLLFAEWDHLMWIFVYLRYQSKAMDGGH